MADQDFIDPNIIRKTIVVEAPQKIAWRVFTEKMGAWWPLAYYKIGNAMLWMRLSSLTSEAAGSSAAKMRAPASGAAFSRGSLLRAWSSHGMSTRIGSMTRP